MSDSESDTSVKSIEVEDLQKIRNWKPARGAKQRMADIRETKRQNKKAGTTEAQREARIKALEKARLALAEKRKTQKSAEQTKAEAEAIKKDAEQKLKEVEVIKEAVPKIDKLAQLESIAKMLEDMKREKQEKRNRKQNILLQEQKSIAKNLLNL